MGEGLMTAAAITSIVGGLFNIGQAVFSKGVHLPEIPQVKLPEQDLQALTQQIQQNSAISDEARKAAIASLQQYNAGQLSPAYQSMYDEYAKQLIMQAKQRAAAQGFTENSAQYQQLMANTYAQLQNQKAQLLQKQLDDAIKTTGLSETTINQLKQKLGVEQVQKQLELQKWQLESEAELGKEKIGLMKGEMIGTGLANVGSGMMEYGKFLDSQNKINTGTSKGETSIGSFGKDKKYPYLSEIENSVFFDK